MCGIAGIVSSYKSSNFVSNVDTMLDLLLHRGPDGRGIESSEFGTFGHVRLSILDSSTFASQPFFDDDYVLVYNGEIYNYNEIKETLPTFHFKSYSDTEVLFHSLKYFGVEATLKKCRGMFAFAWHNRRSGETILARDRFGIKPLFYSTDYSNQLVFASEIKAILSYSNCAVNQFRLLMAPLGGLERDAIQTAWEGLLQVPPGFMLTFSNGRASLRSYFDLSEYFDEYRYHDMNNQSWNMISSHLDKLLIDAVSDMGMGDIPAGSFMSGGLDSGLVSYYGKRSNPQINLFTSDVSGPLSEYHLAEINADAIDSSLIKSTYRDEDCLSKLVNATWHYESPLVVHFNALPLSELAATTRLHGVKAVLTGEGADELFVGYPHLVGGATLKFLNAPYSLLDRIYQTFPLLSRLRAKNKFGVDYFKEMRTNSEGGFLSDGVHLASEKFSFLPLKSRNDHLLTFQMIKSHLLSLLWRNDRMGMMYSIESRFPFLDERIVEFAINLPYKFKVTHVPRWNTAKHPFKSGKHILRKLASNYLPHSISYGQKTGFPVSGLLRMQVHNAFFNNGVLQQTMQLNDRSMETFLDALSPYFKSLMFMTELWARLFVEGQSKEIVNRQVIEQVRISN